MHLEITLDTLERAILIICLEDRIKTFVHARQTTEIPEEEDFYHREIQRTESLMNRIKGTS